MNLANTSKINFKSKQKALLWIINYFIVTHRQSYFSQYLLFVLSTFQYLSILLWVQIASFADKSSDNLFYFVKKVSGAFALVNILDFTAQDWIYYTLILLLWLYFFGLFVFILFLIFSLRRQDGKSFDAIRTAAATVFQIHHQFIFYGGNIILMLPLSPNFEGRTFMNYQTQNTPLILANLVLIVFNYILGLSTAFFCFDPFPGRNLFACHTSSLQISIFVFKAVMSPLITVSGNNIESFQIPFILLTVTFSFGKIFFLFKHFPYYDWLAMKLLIIFIGISCSFSFVNITMLLIFGYNKIEAKNFLFLDAVFSPIMIKIFLAYLQRVLKRAGPINWKKVKTQDQFFKKLFAVDALNKRTKLSLNDEIKAELFEIFFLGDMVQHSKDCRNKDCFCYFALSNDESKKFGKVNDLRQSLSAYKKLRVYNLLVKAIENIQPNFSLKITMASFALEEHNYSIRTGLLILYSIPENNLTILQEVKKTLLKHKFQKTIYEDFKRKSKGILNMKEFLDFHNNISHFVNLLKLNTSKYIDFWNYYKEPDLRMQKLFNKSVAIEKGADQIAHKWNIYTNEHPSFFIMMKDLYSMYLKVVRNCPYASEKIMVSNAIKSYLQKTKLEEDNSINELTLNLPDTISFYVSMSKDKLGRILHVSPNINSTLGYTQDELMDKNISYIMPPSFADKHDAFLQAHIQKSEAGQAAEYSTTTNYVKLKSGYVLPCSTYVTIIPYSQTNLIYLGAVRIIKSKFEHIILDKRGCIDSVSREICKTLNLESKERLNIKDICSDLDLLHKIVDDDNSFSTRFRSKYERIDRKKPSEDLSLRKQASSFDTNFFANLKDVLTEKSNEANSMEIDFFKHMNNRRVFLRYDVIIAEKTLIDRKVLILLLRKNLSKRDESWLSRPFIKEIDNKSTSQLSDSSDIPQEKIFKRKNTPSWKPFFTLKKIHNCDSPDNTDSRPFYPMESTIELKSSKVLAQSSKNLMKIPITEKTSVNLDEVKDSQRDLLNTFRNLNKSVETERRREPTDEELHIDVKPKLEEAIYAIPTNKIVNQINLIIRYFLVICVFLFFLTCLDVKDNLGLIESNIGVLVNADFRLLRIVEMNRRAGILNMYENGMISNDRYSHLTVPSTKNWTIELMGIIQQRLLLLNNRVRDALQLIQEDLQNEFYSKVISSKSQDIGIRVGNGLDIATDLMAACQRLSRTPASLIDKDNGDIQFILQNTVNDLLLSGEDFNTIIVEDNKIKFNSLQRFITVFSACISIVGLALAFLFLWYQISFAKDRNKLIDIFMRINLHEIDNSKKKALAFRSILEENKWDFQSTMVKNLGLIDERKQGMESFKTNNRSVNLDGINNKLFLAQGLSFFLLLLVVSPFFSALTTILYRDSRIKDGINDILYAGEKVYELSLLFSSTYKYMMTNGTATLRNNPIDTAWEELFENLLASQNFYPKLLSEEKSKDRDPELNATLNELIKGNICKQVPPNQYPALCPVVAHELLTKGITAMDNFILATLDRIKEEFVDSTRTLNDFKRIIQDENLIQIEFFFPQWCFQAHERIAEILEADTLTHIVQANFVLELLMVFCILSYLFLGIIIPHYFLGLFNNERVEWKKMFRKIPFSAVVKSKLLKSYLLRQSNGILDSLKSHL